MQPKLVWKGLKALLAVSFREMLINHSSAVNFISGNGSDCDPESIMFNNFVNFWQGERKFESAWEI